MISTSVDGCQHGARSLSTSWARMPSKKVLPRMKAWLRVNSMARASGNSLIPSCSPSGSTRRTSRARMRSLMRGSLVVTVAAIRLHSLSSGHGLPVADEKGAEPPPTEATAVANRSHGPGAHLTDCIVRTASWPGGGFELRDPASSSISALGYQS